MKTDISDQVRDCYGEYFIPPLLTAKSLILMWCWLALLKRSNVQSGRFLGEGGSLWSLIDKKYVKGSVSPWFSSLTCTQNTHWHPSAELLWVSIRAQNMALSWESFTGNRQTNTGRHNVGWSENTFQWEKLEAIAEIYSLFWKSVEGNSGYKWGQWDSTWFQDLY